MRNLIVPFGVMVAAVFISLPAQAAVDVTLSPRVWLFFDDFSLPGGSARGPSGNPFVGSQEPFDVWMYGASISFSSTEFLSDTSFTLTALYGTDGEKRVNLGGAINELSDGNTQVVFTRNENNQDLERLDVEFTAQTRLNDFVGWLAGLRYERTRIDFDSRNVFGVGTTTEGPAAFGASAPGRINLGQGASEGEGGYDLYSIRAGLAGALPVSDDGAHRLYASLLAFVGYQDPVDKNVTQVFEDRWLAGPDISLGYIWSTKSKIWNITTDIGIDFRYRAMFFFPLSGDSDADAPEVTHGPNLSINIGL